jgi:hypothetical protein
MATCPLLAGVPSGDRVYDDCGQGGQVPSSYRIQISTAERQTPIVRCESQFFQPLGLLVEFGCEVYKEASSQPVIHWVSAHCK